MAFNIVLENSDFHLFYDAIAVYQVFLESLFTDPDCDLTEKEITTALFTLNSAVMRLTDLSFNFPFKEVKLMYDALCFYLDCLTTSNFPEFSKLVVDKKNLSNIHAVAMLAGKLKPALQI